MALTINTNIQSLVASRALYKNTMDLQRSVERMSTGLRVNRAGDDAASAAIADTMTAEIQGLGKATQNAQDGISMAQTIDGGLSAVQENLQRIRELWVQGSNGTLSADEKDSIQREINERVTTIEQIATTVKFNGNALLLSGTNKTMQTGAYDSETTTLTLATGTADVGVGIDIDATTNGSMGEGSSAALAKFRLASATVRSQDNTNADAGDLDDLDDMIGNISRMRGAVGAFQNALESKIEFMMLHKENVSASKGRMIDLDVAAESSKLVKAQILQKAATSMLSQANSAPMAALDLIP